MDERSFLARFGGSSFVRCPETMGTSSFACVSLGDTAAGEERTLTGGKLPKTRRTHVYDKLVRDRRASSVLAGYRAAERDLARSHHRPISVRHVGLRFAYRNKDIAGRSCRRSFSSARQE